MLLLVFDLLGKHLMNLYLYSRTDVHHFQIVEKCLRHVSEVYFCMVVKHAPCQQEIRHILKLVTMQWFDGYVLQRWNNSTLLKSLEEDFISSIFRMYSDGIDFGCLVIYIDRKRRSIIDEEDYELYCRSLNFSE